MAFGGIVVFIDGAFPVAADISGADMSDFFQTAMFSDLPGKMHDIDGSPDINMAVPSRCDKFPPYRLTACHRTGVFKTPALFMVRGGPITRSARVFVPKIIRYFLLD